MPETNDGLRRRVEELERHYIHLSAAVQRVESEQTHVTEMLKSNFNALNKGQELLQVKVDGFVTLINTMTGDAERTPAGKALMREIEFTQKGLDEHKVLYEGRVQSLEEQVVRLTAYKNRAHGAIWLGCGSGAIAVIALIRQLLHL